MAQRFTSLDADIASEVLEFTRKFVTTPVPLEYALVADNKQKRLIKVEKIADKHVVNYVNEAQILIIVNETMWDLLSANLEDGEKSTEILIRDELQGISINEKDVISVKQPSFKSSKPIIDKYSFAAVDRAKELETLAVSQIKDAAKKIADLD